MCGIREKNWAAELTGPGFEPWHEGARSTNASGFLRSESVGAIFLQRAKDAKQVYARVVNLCVSQTPAIPRKTCLFSTAEFQAQIMKQTLEQCSLKSSDVTYIEADGTAIKSWDLDELKAIDLVYGQDRSYSNPLLIGSIKSNIGYIFNNNTHNSIIKDLDFSETVRVIDMTKRTMRCAGIWPEEVHDSKFIFFSAYLTIHCLLANIDIAMNISNLSHIVAALLENAFNLMALLKMCICRIKKKSLTKLLQDIRTDFIIDNYKSREEQIAFLTYNKFSQKFVKITLIVCFLSSSTYYFMSLVMNVEMVISNSSYGYRLPYKVWLLIEPTDVITYVCLCCYQFLYVPTIIIVYVGTDCLFVSLVLHVSGLFSALSCKVRHVLDDPKDRQRRMKNLIVRHVRLIRLSESLEEGFNLVIFQQLVGNTLQLCLLGYDTIASTDGGEGKMLLPIFLILGCVCSTLLAYCYMGECLVKESSILSDAFYHCNWYDSTEPDKKLVHICMMCSTKFVRLTSGKFCTLSLNTFTDVIKTSMAYLSVLRTFT